MPTRRLQNYYFACLNLEPIVLLQITRKFPSTSPIQKWVSRGVACCSFSQMYYFALPLVSTTNALCSHPSDSAVLSGFESCVVTKLLSNVPISSYKFYYHRSKWLFLICSYSSPWTQFWTPFRLLGAASWRPLCFKFNTHLRLDLISIRWIMVRPHLSAEIIIAIILGILQLIVGLVSLWQQYYLGRMNSKLPPYRLIHPLTSSRIKGLTGEVMQSETMRQRNGHT